MANFLDPEAVLRNYFHAKDENRPHVLERVFVPEAELIVENHSGTTAFPARAIGREAIAEVLVRSFGQTYENVYSFYLRRPIGTEDSPIPARDPAESRPPQPRGSGEPIQRRSPSVPAVRRQARLTPGWSGPAARAWRRTLARRHCPARISKWQERFEPS